MPTIYLYPTSEQVVQQIGNAGLPATLQLNAAAGTDVNVFPVDKGISPYNAYIKSVDVQLQSVIDDSPPKLDKKIPSIAVSLFAGEIPVININATPLIPATLRLYASPDANVQLYPVNDQVKQNQRLLSLIDILVHITDISNITLIIQKDLIAQTTDGIALFQAQTLIVQGASHIHTTDDIAIIQQFTLAVQKTIHIQNAGNPVLIQQNLLIVQEANHLLSNDGIVLIQNNILVVSKIIHSHFTDDIVLTENKILIISETFHNHSASNVALSIQSLLVIQNASHILQSDNVIGWEQLLIIANAIHGHIADNVELGSGFPIINLAGDIIDFILSGDAEKEINWNCDVGIITIDGNNDLISIKGNVEKELEFADN
jgi:hypothetical protein